MITLITHVAAFLFGCAGGGYVGYRWGASIVKDVQAVKNVGSGLGGSTK
jgi:hypothetical protein